MDAWFDEGEEVTGHLRDPYHRVDVRSTSRHVRVVAGDDVVAQLEIAAVVRPDCLLVLHVMPTALRRKR